MPSPVPLVRVLALIKGKDTIYLTEVHQRYENEREIMSALLTYPHKERYMIRAVEMSSWDRNNPLTQEQFEQHFNDLWTFSPYMLYSVVDFKKAFDALFEQGGGYW